MYVCMYMSEWVCSTGWKYVVLTIKHFVYIRNMSEFFSQKAKKKKNIRIIYADFRKQRTLLNFT